LEIGDLPLSHKKSYLKLIPKAGKDLSKLTNWRPITLSNCDHKLITKTYSRRMTEVMADSLKERQTAYLKGRMINDNLRSIVATVNIANIEEECHGLLVANGKIVNGFRIKRGVKQGDALSCILFIMCLEPLLCNIRNNLNIEPIRSNHCRIELPKVGSYADDVFGIIKCSLESVQGLFNEYSRLTALSGLELNANKTEIMTLRVDRRENFNIEYNNKYFHLVSVEKLKINGIFFQADTNEMRATNVGEALQRIEAQLKKWSR